MVRKVNRLSVYSILMATLLFLFASSAQYYNHQVTHYIGNEYVQPALYLLTLPLCLMWVGLKLFTNKYPFIEKRILSSLTLYLFLCLMVYLTSAIQYTPFQSIDKSLIQLDNLLFFKTTHVLNWTYQHPLMQGALAICYGLLNWELVLVFFIIIFLPDEGKNSDFYFCMLFTAMVGFIFYYFFPTIAPASLFDNPHFYKEQYDTGKKFYDIHHYLTPNTLEGGMIAMPSFHTIWALLCQHHLRRFPIIWYCVLPINIMIVLACVMLGWHYLIDVLSALFLTGIAVLLCSIQAKRARLALNCYI